MFKNFLGVIGVCTMFVGCATVPMGNVETATRIKQFNAAKEGQSNLYIYRSNSIVGAALKKNILLDGKCVGESARGVFFFEEVTGNQEHKVSTESEFSPNDLIVKTVAGNSYFIEQYIKPGVFVGGANLKLVDEETGKKAIQELSFAEKGHCSQ